MPEYFRRHPDLQPSRNAARTLFRRCSLRICRDDRVRAARCDSRSTDGTAEYLARRRGGASQRAPSARRVQRPRGGAQRRHRRGARRDRALQRFRHLRVAGSALAAICAITRERTTSRSSAGSSGQGSRGVRAQARSPGGARPSSSADAQDGCRGCIFSPETRRFDATICCASGGFDENFTGYGHEDLELGYRLEKAGLEIVYEPQRGKLSLPRRAARRSEGEDETGGAFDGALLPQASRFRRAGSISGMTPGFARTALGVDQDAVAARLFRPPRGPVEIRARPRATILLRFRHQSGAGRTRRTVSDG